ncbi:MAG TPA: phosphotransferase, partial [Roseiarcus sp.]|nr:phosphotransferase [Roseiarcus sp.]
EVVELEGRLGFVCERVSGSSLAERVKRRPWATAGLGRLLARLHQRVHLAPVPPGLPRLEERLAGNIRDARKLLGKDVDRVLSGLEALAGSGVICHFDFHPGNVLEAGDRVYIIDWLGAGVGPPAMDVARTLLLLESPFLPPGFSPLLRPVIWCLRQVLASAYLAAYLALSGLLRAEVDHWRIPVAAARLSEEIPGEREWLLGIVRAGAFSRAP